MATTVSYGIQNVIMLVWIVSFFASDPLNYKEDGLQKQGLIPTSLWLTRLKNPLRQNIIWSDRDKPDVPSMPIFTRLTSSDQMNYKSSVYNLIEKYTLTQDTAISTIDEISGNLISPYTRAMAMMGCYGDATTSNVLKSPYASLMANDKNTAFMLNIILQELELSLIHI